MKKILIKLSVTTMLLAGVLGIVQAPKASAEETTVTTLSDPGGGGRIQP